MWEDTRLGDPREWEWEQIGDPAAFSSPQWTERIEAGLRLPSVQRTVSGGTTVLAEASPERQQVVVQVLTEQLPRALTALQALEAQLNAEFVRKQELIRLLFLAAVAQQPLLIVGSPGTAKTRVVTRFCEGLGITRLGEKAAAPGQASSFSYLLNAFTEPDELLGPVSFPDLQQGVFRRLNDNAMTRAHVIFLDEVFKANSAILNALLTIINERRVYEAGGAVKANSKVVVGATNSVPSPRQLQDLAAFYERFVVRCESRPLPENDGPRAQPSEHRVRLLQQGFTAEVNDLRGSYDPTLTGIEPVASLNHILLCNRAVAELFGGWRLEGRQMEEFVGFYHRLTANLRRDATGLCSIDDRKFVKLFTLCRASMVYPDNQGPWAGSLDLLGYIWNEPDAADRLWDMVQVFKGTIGRSHESLLPPGS